MRIYGVGQEGHTSVPQAVGVFVDGVARPSPGSVFSTLFDTERVEVLRGSQGILYEIGLKRRGFEGTLQVNMALFYQTYSDFQVQIPNAKTATTITPNAEATSPGAELEVSWAAIPNLRLNGALTYIDARYDSFVSAPCSVEQRRALPAEFFYSQDLSGTRLNDTPEWAGNLRATYENTFGNIGMTWFTMTNLSFRSFLISRPEHDRFSEIPGYGAVNARLGLRAPYESWEASAWVKNAFDKDYTRDLRRVAFDTIVREIGKSRQFGITGSYYF